MFCCLCFISHVNTILRHIATAHNFPLWQYHGAPKLSVTSFFSYYWNNAKLGELLTLESTD